jgi:hypothetical protein
LEADVPGKLVSMKTTRKEREKQFAATTPAEDAPVYPFGLEVRLDEESLKKLGMEDLPEVGTVMTLVARVEVTAVSSHASESGENQSVTLQITDLAVGEGTPAKDIGAKLYDGNKAEK